ncbi:MAG: cellulase family glycosylhydrolase [Kiritimatiellae bacterium]|nr:cellulase family glycosylhydrolase [Kiritimatiellia bacterium]
MKTKMQLILLLCALGLNAMAADVYRPPQRWRGFNLMEMFIKGSGMSPGHYSEQDFRIISELGFNFVRLPLDYRFWINDGNWESINEEALKPLDQAIAFGKKYNIHVMLNFHRAPGYTVAKPPEQLDLFNDPEALRVCVMHWGMIARRYQDIPVENLSFNLFNEPSEKIEVDDYVRVVAAVSQEIRRYQPARLIVADGLAWGSKVVPELFKHNIGQATRGYAPSSISHYRASWAGNPTAMPAWPPSGAVSPIYGPAKKEHSHPLVIERVPPCKMIIEPGRVSGNLTIEVTAAGKVIATFPLEPQQGEGWSNAEYKEEWKIYQADCDQRLEVLIPEGLSTVTLSISKGDWAALNQITLKAPDGQSAVLSFQSSWYGVNPAITFKGFGGHSPFQAQGMEDGITYLRNHIMGPWEQASKEGQLVMVGEFGAFQYTPHRVVLAWMEDYLKIWQEARMGWALWNLRGGFGVLDSNREDVVYEDFHGHKLDRQMLNLLQRY